MGLLKQKELDYYIGRKEFTGDGSTTIFTLTEFQGAIHPTLALHQAIVMKKLNYS